MEREAADARERREHARVTLEQSTAGMGRRAARAAARVVRTLHGRQANERRLHAITHRLEMASSERETLIDEHDRVRDDIRDRLRLAVTTPARLCLQELPRRAFDVVVLDDAAWLPLPVAFLAAARTRRSVITLGEVGPDLPSLLGKTDLSALWLRRDVFAAAGLAAGEGATLQAPYVAQLSEASAFGRSGSDGPCLWQHCPRGPRPVGRHAAKVAWSPCPACP